MANLKIIWTTGSPFSPSCIDKIAYETSPSEWNVYRDGSWSSQSSSTGRGYRPATAEEIAEHWKVLHPKWTPEPGDKVIVTQDIGTWCNKRGTIVNADGSEYWIVKRDEDGRTCNFMKQNQMILAPYEESVKPVETTESIDPIKSMHGFTIGDIVMPNSDKFKDKQCIVKVLGSCSVGVQCPSDVGLGHGLDGHCPDDTGWWYHPSSLELVSKVEPEKQEPKEDDAKVLGLFSIGDKVIPRSGPFKHKKGSILCVNTKFKSLGVVFDSFEGAANSLDGQCEQGFGYYYTSVELTPDTSEGFSVGDTVKPTCGPYKGEVGTILCFSDSGRPGVFFEVRKDAGHNLGGYCAKDHGWFYDGSDLTLVSAAGSTLPGVPKVPKTSTPSIPPPKEGYVTVRIFTEEEFKAKDLWDTYDGKEHPTGWNSDGEMNKYLGTYIQLSKSKFDGSSSFRYEDWHFAANNYEVIHEGVEPKPEPKPETTSKSGIITVRFFTETEFKAKDKWYTSDGYPKGWVKSMNKYLGQTVDIKKSDIKSDGSFHYNGWLFDSKDYEILTLGYESKSSPKVEPKVEPEVKPKEPEMKPQRFKVGDRVTYKSVDECGGRYRHGGTNQGGFVGTITSYNSYYSENGCYGIQVTCKDGCNYSMIESEFYEYDGSTPVKAKQPEKKFAVGDKVTYKSHSDLGRVYCFGGGDQGKKEGTVLAYLEFQPEYNCYKIKVTTPHGTEYGMLESEFYEYDTLYPGAIFLGTVGLQIHQTVPKSKDDLSQYNQSPVLIHKKPTKRLVVVDAY